MHKLILHWCFVSSSECKVSFSPLNSGPNNNGPPLIRSITNFPPLPFRRNILPLNLLPNNQPDTNRANSISNSFNFTRIINEPNNATNEPQNNQQENANDEEEGPNRQTQSNTQNNRDQRSPRLFRPFFDTFTFNQDQLGSNQNNGNQVNQNRSFDNLREMQGRRGASNNNNDLNEEATPQEAQSDRSNIFEKYFYIFL